MIKSIKKFEEGRRLKNSTENNGGYSYPISIIRLGKMGLPETDRLMKKLMSLREDDRIPDLLLILAHHPVLSIGARKLNENDLLKPWSYFENLGIQIYQAHRGGGLSYHWDGQLVAYPVLKLRKAEQHISEYMYRLEEVGLRTLNELGVIAQRKRDETAQIGLWHGEDKIASMGIYVSRWVTSFGFALNLAGDKSPARYIRPCGLDVQLTTVSEVTGKEADREFATQKVIQHFTDVFQRFDDNSFSKYDLMDLLVD